MTEHGRWALCRAIAQSRPSQQWPICQRCHLRYSRELKFTRLVVHARHQSTRATKPEVRQEGETRHGEHLDATQSGELRHREPAKVLHDHEDIDIDSLEATLAAHKRRNSHRQARIRFVRPNLKTNEAVSNTVKSSASLDVPRRAAPWEGLPIFSSFEDFRAEHDASDEELIKRLGIKVESSEDASLEDGNSPPKTASIERSPLDFSSGKAQMLQKEFRNDPILPLSVHQLQFSYLLNRSSEEYVSAVINDFEFYSRPTKTEEKAVQHIVAQVEEVFAKTLPNSRLVLHGSYATGLAGPLSDIDFNIPLAENLKKAIQEGMSGDPQKVAEQLQEPLRELEKEFKESGGNFEAILYRRRQPLLLVEHQVSGLKIQISSGRYVDMATQTVLSILDEYPSIRPLFVLLRHVLFLRGLHSPGNGGVSSYPLFAMVLTALRHSGTASRGESLAKQLIAVLDFWSNANIHTLGYAANPPITFPKFPLGSEMYSSGNDITTPKCSETSSSDPTKIEDCFESGGLQFSTASEPTLATTDAAAEPVLSAIAQLQYSNDLIRRQANGRRSVRRHPWQLCLQDPANPTNDLGRTSFRIADVIATFRSLQGLLERKMRAWDEATSNQRLVPSSNPLRPFLEADYRMIQARRWKLREVIMGKGAYQRIKSERNGRESPDRSYIARVLRLRSKSGPGVIRSTVGNGDFGMEGQKVRNKE